MHDSWCALRLLIPADCYDEVLGIVWGWEGTEGVEEREEPGFVGLTVHLRKLESLDSDIEGLRQRQELYRQFALRVRAFLKKLRGRVCLKKLSFGLFFFTIIISMYNFISGNMLSDASSFVICHIRFSDIVEQG